ncbi:MAG: hypothetical protein IJR66_01910 [Clostridia bacterium]|nr:hypothetical protein [Clostridia bacterium]
MTEQKAKRVIVASTVGAVLLLFILLSVMVYQIVKIRIEKKRYDELVTICEEYKNLNEEGKKTIEARSSYWWIVQRARELGYVFDGDYIYEQDAK